MISLKIWHKLLILNISSEQEKEHYAPFVKIMGLGDSGLYTNHIVTEPFSGQTGYYFTSNDQIKNKKLQ